MKNNPEAGARLDSNPADTIDIAVLARRASALHDQGHFDAAQQLALDILARKRDDVDVLLILAHSLRELGRFSDALKVLGRIAKLDPNHARAHAAYALTLFYMEDWERAWRAFDVRFKLMEQAPKVTRRGKDGKPAPMTPWRGGEYPPSLLVLGEQGLGDTIQFVRFLPMLVAAGTKVTCVVQQRLFKLLKTLDSDIDFRPIEQAGSVQGMKAWTPLMHLPRALDLKPAQFVPRMPYLHADPERTQYWAEKIGMLGFKVGIVWQGNPDKRIDQGRSAPLSAFAPLAEIPGVRLISLQHGIGRDQIGAVPFAERVETLGEDFDAGPDGFIDTAAVMQSLDLVVTVDTSVGHLAGALGRPVFVLLKRVGPDWRWLYGRSDSVWYPTAKLFRQVKVDDWSEVLQRVAADIRQRMNVETQSGSPMTPVSVGELLDKLVILEIKLANVKDETQRANIAEERDALAATGARYRGSPEVESVIAELKAVNQTLWNLEDEIRDCERRKDFGDAFREAARAIYRQNDRRAAFKKELNRLCGSRLVEEKLYQPYQAD